MLPRSTLEQWSVLRTVVECGGFSAAAQVLHRSQSSVSYAVARLRETLGVELLEVQGRRTVASEAGAALLAEVAPLIDELNRVEARGRGIARGEAVRIRLLVDSLFPKSRLFAALRGFAERHPHAELHLVETVRQMRHEVAEDYDLAILVGEPGAADADPLLDMRMLAVVQAGHPLLEAGMLTPTVLARYPCVEIRGVDPASPAPRQGRLWRMNTVETAIDAISHGLGYGWLPEELIGAALARGQLRRLALAHGAERRIPLVLYRRPSLEVDPAIETLAGLLAGQGGGT